MSDVTTLEQTVDGRPSSGVALTAAVDAAAERRAKSRNLRPLARLLPFIGDHAGDAFAAGLFLLVSTASTLGMTAGARMVVDKGFASSASVGALNRNFILLALLAAVLASATALRYYFITKLGERVVADLRKALYRHILSLDQIYFLKTRTGEVLSRMTADIAIIENLVGSSSSMGLRNALSFVGALAMLIVVSPKLTGFVILLIPLVLVPLVLFGRHVRRLSVSAQDRFAEAVGYAGETLDGLDTLQAFGRERSAAERFGLAVELAFSTSKSRIFARAIMTALVMFLVFGGVAVILWWGAHAVKAGELSSGQLFQFVLLSVLAASSVGTLGEVYGDFQKGAGAMERVSELLDAQPQIAKPAQPIAMPVPARGEVAFNNVVFA
jgi:ATP-binding cassette subfamily B protein